LSSSLGAPTGLSDVRWTRTTVGGPNYLGGSVTPDEEVPPVSGIRERKIKRKGVGMG
jgi:hypothetical protein